MFYFLLFGIQVSRPKILFFFICLPIGLVYCLCQLSKDSPVIRAGLPINLLVSLNPLKLLVEVRNVITRVILEKRARQITLILKVLNELVNIVVISLIFSFNLANL